VRFRGRANSLRILCDQLEHTQANLRRLEEEMEPLVSTDPRTHGLQKTSGVRSENSGRAACRDFREVDRFAHTDQAVADSGMDVKIKESGKWKGKAKLSKRGSGSTRVRCSTWPPCEVFVWKAAPLGLTHIIWWSEDGSQCQL
jgi:transposase